MRYPPKPTHARMLGRARRHTLFGTALIGFVCCMAQPSDAYIEHPWCTSGRGWAGGTSCAFDTYEHCMENARLYTANCVANPVVTPFPQATPQAARPRARSRS